MPLTKLLYTVEPLLTTDTEGTEGSGRIRQVAVLERRHYHSISVIGFPASSHDFVESKQLYHESTTNFLLFEKHFP